MRYIRDFNFNNFLSVIVSQAREMFSPEYIWLKFFYIMFSYSIVYGLANIAGPEFYLVKNKLMLVLAIFTPLTILRDGETFQTHRKIIKKIMCSGRWVFLVPFSTILIQHLTSNKLLNETVYLKLEPFLFLWVSLISGYLLLYACYKFTRTFQNYTLSWISFIILVYHVLQGGV